MGQAEKWAAWQVVGVGGRRAGRRQRQAEEGGGVVHERQEPAMTQAAMLAGMLSKNNTENPSCPGQG